MKCPTCEGSRLRKESLYFKVDGKSIADLVNMDIVELGKWSENLLDRLSNKQKKISEEIIKEIQARIQFLLDV